MKKSTCLIIAAFFIINSVNSQITKGNWLMGGNLSFLNSKSNGTASGNTNNTELNISPLVGIFAFNKAAIGLRANYRNAIEKYDITPGNSINNRQYKIGIGPFVRYYFLPEEQKVNILGEFNLLYNQSVSIPYNGSKSKSSSIEYSFQTGAAIFFNNSVALEALIGYSFLKEKEQNYNVNNLRFNIGFQIHLEKN